MSVHHFVTGRAIDCEAGGGHSLVLAVLRTVNSGSLKGLLMVFGFGYLGTGGRGDDGGGCLHLGRAAPFVSLKTPRVLKFSCSSDF